MLVRNLVDIEKYRRKGKGRRYCPLAALAILNQDDLKNRMNGYGTWRNGCSEKMDDHPVHTTPNYPLPKWMFSQKLFFKSSLPLNG